ncbi:radical SAM family heme chaperone HemW [Hydrogenobacter hydrogenophilus]|uniref:Heme chaperone HemW n=1 Tax=Hydrogenobacter hydrogenophilus TaxID=35835 RepID=A0A285NY35_9AQUI|nr:radical SAM family heme chaperone HemW [Hydrogenobacter hydrogenophilus]SNZ14395.1 oxygen-independent coproporphyrinogen-3 oxidase [Hydrogenobacter hydrogenophilus]
MIESLYIHIPFCSYKCPYCDFVSFTSSLISHQEYLQLLIKELGLYKEESFCLKTLYLGGGTPSLIDPSLYETFLKDLSLLVDTARLEEFTIECNPETYREEEFKQIADLGINRVSVGVQSFTERGLKVLGRKHTVKDSIDCIRSAFKAGIENISVDIIYAYPNQTLKDLKEELKVLMDLPIKHLSCYLLTPYEDTLFGRLFSEEKLKLPDSDQVADMYLFWVNELQSLGFEHYEISNFALPGYECKHNLSYWLGREFLGLGVSAWSYVKNVRFGNTKNMREYAQSIKEGRKPVEYKEVLEGKSLLKDILFIRLRTKWGIPKEYAHLIPEELLEFFKSVEDGIRLKEEGMLLINEILLRIKYHALPY